MAPPPRPRSGPLTPRTGRLALVALTLLGTGCAGATPDPGLEPLGSEPAGATTTTSPAPTSLPEPSAGATATTTAPPTGPGSGAGDPARRTVDDALARYDRALTAVAADPAALDRPGDPAAAAWADAVVSGAVLTAQVTGRIRARAADGVVVTPPPSGLSFVHRALVVVGHGPDRADEIGFTWCGWSPGIGRSAADGSVVDDAVAHSRGTGTVRRDGDVWRVATLDETEVVVLAAGTDDPCAAEVRDAREGP